MLRPVLDYFPSNFVFRNMTIEEVSVLFDTGRKGDAAAAAQQFHTNNKLDDMLENDDDGAKGPSVSRVERV